MHLSVSTYVTHYTLTEMKRKAAERRAKRKKKRADMTTLRRFDNAAIKCDKSVPHMVTETCKQENDRHHFLWHRRMFVSRKEQIGFLMPEHSKKSWKSTFRTLTQRNPIACESKLCTEWDPPLILESPEAKHPPASHRENVMPRGENFYIAAETSISRVKDN